MTRWKKLVRRQWSVLCGELGDLGFTTFVEAWYPLDSGDPNIL